MASTLNADNGVVSGSAGLKSSADSTGVLALQTNGTTAVTVDTAQNVGVGVTPSAWGTVGNMEFPSNYAVGYNGHSQNAYNSSGGWKYSTTAAASVYQQGAGAHKWFNAPSGTAGNAITFTQAMTLDASGNLLVGTTSALDIGSSSNTGFMSQPSGFTAIIRDGNTGLVVGRQTSNGTAIELRRSGTAVGTISVTTTATAYNTSSDYRLKENVAPMTGALSKVAALKPCTYTWKSDGSAGEGFIAHELQEVVAGCVTGEKDATRIEQYEITPAVPATFDEDGNELTPAVEAVMGEREVPVYQGIDTSFLVATLTAAIQEQQQIITTLTQRVEALEGAKA